MTDGKTEELRTRKASSTVYHCFCAPIAHKCEACWEMSASALFLGIHPLPARLPGLSFRLAVVMMHLAAQRQPKKRLLPSTSTQLRPLRKGDLVL